MSVLMLVPYYIAWHYTRAIQNFITIFTNLVSFVFSYFSVVFLFKTLFSPFKRMSENYTGGLDFENFFSTIVINILMRIIGFVIRTVLILIGLVCTLVAIGIGILAFGVWLVFPLLVPFLFFAGLTSVLTT